MELLIGGFLMLLLPAFLEFAVGLFNFALRFIRSIFGISMQFLRLGVGRQNERQAALTKASYGTVMLLGAGYLYLWPEQFEPNIREWFSIALPVLAVWGTAWVLIGAGWRSRGLRDGDLIFRFLLRAGIGIAALIWVPPYQQAEMPLWLLGLLLVITAAVKLVLVMCGGGSAERRITKLLKQRNAPLVPAKTRRFFFW